MEIYYWFLFALITILLFIRFFDNEIGIKVSEYDCEDMVLVFVIPLIGWFVLLAIMGFIIVQAWLEKKKFRLPSFKNCGDTKLWKRLSREL